MIFPETLITRGKHAGDTGTVAHKFDPPNNHHIIYYKSQL